MDPCGYLVGPTVPARVVRGMDVEVNVTSPRGRAMGTSGVVHDVYREAYAMDPECGCLWSVDMVQTAAWCEMWNALSVHQVGGLFWERLFRSW